MSNNLRNVGLDVHAETIAVAVAEANNSYAVPNPTTVCTH
jgi:hypothetical protein